MRTGRGLVALCSVVTLVLLASGSETHAAKPPPPPRMTAFVHVPTSANQCVLVTGANPEISVLNDPLANGNPNAIILVTLNDGTASELGTLTIAGPITVVYDDLGTCGTSNRWLLVNRDKSDLVSAGQRLNIFIWAP